jgi:hypothetical protein
MLCQQGKPVIRIHTLEGQTLNITASLTVLQGIRQVCDEIQEEAVRAGLVGPSTADDVSYK